MRFALVSIVSVACLGSAGPARAASVSTTMTVSATVTSTCLVSAAPLAFGDYQGRQLDASSTINATCSKDAGYQIGIDAGQADGATAGQRRLTSSDGAALTYTIFSDGARHDVWGTSAGVDTVAGVGNGNAQSFPVYGRIAASQSPPRGTYSDAVRVTIDF